MEKGPSIIYSKLGPIVAGEFESSNASTNPVRSFLTLTSSLEDQLQRFWSLEEVPESHSLKPSELNCENYYSNTTTRDNSGRYIVRLPFVEEPQSLGSSKEVALSRFSS